MLSSNITRKPKVEYFEIDFRHLKLWNTNDDQPEAMLNTFTFAFFTLPKNVSERNGKSINVGLCSH